MDANIKATDTSINVDGGRVRVFSERDRGKIDELGRRGNIVDQPDCFYDRVNARSICTTPSRSHHTAAGQDEDITIVLGVNEKPHPKEHHHRVERLVHDHCLAPGRQGAARQFTIAKLDDHDPFVHKRQQCWIFRTRIAPEREPPR